jgi:hypothetical protein
MLEDVRAGLTAEEVRLGRKAAESVNAFAFELFESSRGNLWNVKKYRALPWNKREKF